MLEKIKNKHLLIDGDIIRYRCGFAAEKTKYLVSGEAYYETWWEKFDTKKEAVDLIEQIPKDQNPLLWSRKEIQPVENALQIVKTTMENLFEKLQPSGYTVWLTGKENFRDKIAKTKPYKGNRTQAKPVHYEAIGEYLVKEYGAKFSNGREADDEIGISLTNLGDVGVCVSNDKDLDQISGWHYDWVSGDAYRVSRKQGDYQLYTQILTGDSTDNVPGLEGVGPAKASAILDGAASSAELCKRVWTEYRNRFDDPQRAKNYFWEQASLVYIFRKEGDYFNPPIAIE
jgi:5'-3' exonuclease